MSLGPGQEVPFLTPLGRVSAGCGDGISVCPLCPGPALPAARSQMPVLSRAAPARPTQRASFLLSVSSHVLLSICYVLGIVLGTSVQVISYILTTACEAQIIPILQVRKVRLKRLGVLTCVLSVSCFCPDQGKTGVKRQASSIRVAMHRWKVTRGPPRCARYLRLWP